MPNKPLKPCVQPGCPNPATERYCQQYINNRNTNDTIAIVVLLHREDILIAEEKHGLLFFGKILCVFIAWKKGS
jgi:hypothetical protein